MQVNIFRGINYGRGVFLFLCSYFAEYLGWLLFPRLSRQGQAAELHPRVVCECGSPLAPRAGEHTRLGGETLHTAERSAPLGGGGKRAHGRRPSSGRPRPRPRRIKLMNPSLERPSPTGFAAQHAVCPWRRGPWAVACSQMERRRALPNDHRRELRPQNFPSAS